MQSLRAIPIVLVLAVTSTTIAEARPRPARTARKHFESNKTFGLGLELGEPTGLTGKYWLGESSDRALDFGFGDMYDYYGYRGFALYMDYLFHPLSLASTETFELPFYIGIGGRLWKWEEYGPRYDGYGLGVRVPIGLSFDFNNVPIDIFLQFVPTFDLFFNTPTGYGRGYYFFPTFSFGIRYFFS